MLPISQYALFLGLLNSPTQLDHWPRPAIQSPPADAPPTFKLPGGLRLTIRRYDAVITDAKGAVAARNSHLIVRPDDHPGCPADGFQTVVVKGNFFTIEQQSCGGWFFINEYLTFRYVPATGKIQLHKFGQTFTDRREPDKAVPDKILTEKQFGRRYFDQIDLDALYALPSPK